MFAICTCLVSVKHFVGHPWMNMLVRVAFNRQDGRLPPTWFLQLCMLVCMLLYGRYIPTLRMMMNHFAHFIFILITVWEFFQTFEFGSKSFLLEYLLCMSCHILAIHSLISRKLVCSRCILSWKIIRLNGKMCWNVSVLRLPFTKLSTIPRYW